MGEMLREDERVGLGEAWIRAVAEGAVERLEQFCHPAVASHLMTPRRVIPYDNVTDLAAKFQHWFGDCSDIQVEHSRVEPVGERLGIFYRLRLREGERWSTVEQQIYCTVEEGLIAELHLLCSGFQAAEPDASAASGDALLEMHTGGGQGGSTCALLTPAIKARLREMQPGQVLEVRVDDTSARGDIEAWCRLTGNTLLRISEGEGADLRFFVKKKQE